MSDAWKERERAQEDMYFEKQNKAALERIQKSRAGGEVRKSPIDGKPMTQKILNGVAVDVCETSGGIWLDAGELEQLMEGAKADKNHPGFGGFFSSLLKRK